MSTGLTDIDKRVSELIEHERLRVEKLPERWKREYLLQCVDITLTENKIRDLIEYNVELFNTARANDFKSGWDCAWRICNE